MSGYESSLGPLRDIQTAVEYMDTKKINTPEHLATLKRFYEAKYGDQRFDVIVTSDDNALTFAMANQDDLFNGSPIVFCGVNDLDRHPIRPSDNITGVVEHGEFFPTLQVAFDLFPNTERLLIVCDRTTTGLRNLAEMRAIMATHFGSIATEVLQDVTLEEMAGILADLGEKDLIFFISFWQDGKGSSVSPVALSEVFRTSPVPIFGRSEWMIGRGMIGGKCVSGHHQGLAAGAKARQILAGIPAADIPILQQSPNVFMFDFAEMKRHGVKRRDLPEGAIIYGRPISIYEQHKVEVISTLVLVVVLSALVAALAISIVHRRRAEAALLASEQKYQQSLKMEAVGQLAAGVAHDFNNLLTPIVGFTELMLEDVSPDSSQREWLEAIHESAHLARDLTRELLSFGRKQLMEMRVVRLQRTFDRLEHILRRTTREDIEIKFDIEDDLFPILADPSQLLQACINLGGNAADSMPKGGTLTLTARNVVLAKAVEHHGQSVPAGNYVGITVSDSGEGIPAAIRSRVFDPFFTTKEKGKGTGLGLATVHGIVAQHQGHIWFDSAVGAGTAFTIYLPQAQGNVEVQPDETVWGRIGPPADREKTILVAEDDSMVRMLACEALRKSGYRVIEGKDGQDALEKAAAEHLKIDLLLSDVVMPRVNGLELRDALIEKCPEMAVLLMSGYASDVLGEKGILEERVHLVRKPFTIKELLARVHEVLNARTH